MNFLTSITTVEFRGTWEQWVQANFDANEVNAIIGAVDFEEWVYVSTLAPEPLDFSTTEAASAQNLAMEYIALNGTGSPTDKDIYTDFYSNLKVEFYDTLQANMD